MKPTRMQKACKRGFSNPNELQDFCPLGLQRAQWYMDNLHSSAAEELSAAGCPYGVLSEDEDGYCFFKMMLNKDGKIFTEEEIGKRLGLNLNQVKAILARAISKLAGTPFIKEAKDLRDAGFLYDEEKVDEDIYFPTGFGCSESEPTEEAHEGDAPKPRRGRAAAKSAVPNPDFS
jgi:hypothetical protein